jgi:hypothetical protein
MVRRLMRAMVQRNRGEDAEQFARLDLNLSGISARRADPPGFLGAVDRAPVHAGRCGGLAPGLSSGPVFRDRLTSRQFDRLSSPPDFVAPDPLLHTPPQGFRVARSILSLRWRKCLGLHHRLTYEPQGWFNVFRLWPVSASLASYLLNL